MKKKAVGIIVASSLLVFLLTPILVGVFTPSQYDETYYAELSKMYKNIKTKDKKIVLIGGSSTAFGINVDIMENELNGYKVCPFGLYGQIGTKAMMDLAINHIHKDDIVIISPELTSQSMSLYFSGEEMWKCADTDLSLAYAVDGEQYNDMIGSYYPYLAKKINYAIKGKPHPTDVYSIHSFNDKCQMIYDRPYNILPELCDYDGIIDFNSLIDKDFIDYVNKYNRKISEKKARLYYNYCPINKLAVIDIEGMKEFQQSLNQSLDCFILGSIDDYLFDYEWFYDSNFHLNTLGSIVYSYQLIDDIKVELNDFTIAYRDEINKPTPEAIIIDGDNKDAMYFQYEEITNGYKIVGLTNEGKEKEKLIVPTSYNDKPIRLFDKNTFAGNTNIKEIVIPKTITKIEDYSFFGCTNLESIYLESETPNINVSSHLLDGANKAKIVVKNYEAYTLYIVNYYWSQYASRITYIS